MKKRTDAREAMRALLRERFRRRLLNSLATWVHHLQALATAQHEAQPVQTEHDMLARIVDLFDELADALAELAIGYVEALVEGPAHQAAVLDRAELVERWDLMSQGHMKIHARPRFLSIFLAIREQATGVQLPPWPSNVSQDDVSSALKRANAKTKLDPVQIQELRALEAESARLLHHHFGIVTAQIHPPQNLLLWPVGICAHVVSIAKRVDDERRRQAIAIDAGRVHHNIVTGMRDLPKDRVRHTGAALTVAKPERGDDGIHRAHLIGVPHRKGSRTTIQRAERFEVLAPGLAMQVAFPFDERSSMSMAMVETLNRWRGPLNTWKGPAGLRHWATLLRLLSIEGAREGHVRWTMERHLDAMGASEDTRHDPKALAEIGGIVELLTKLELAVYAPDGTLRLRQTILSAMNKIDRKLGSTWALEGMELVIHPMLYNGVRKPTGETGSNWFPQAAALAKIDHVRFPNSIALGLMLPIRWRWDWGDGRDHTTLSGAKLLEAAGITYTPRHIGVAWKKLRRTLEKLASIDALGRVEWEGDPWTLGALCHLYPPPWARDRTAHALPPVEPPPAAFRTPMTGAELVAWRKAENLTQAAAAARLAVSERTIRNAETETTDKLGPALRKAFAKLVPR